MNKDTFLEEALPIDLDFFKRLFFYDLRKALLVFIISQLHLSQKQEIERLKGA